MKDYKTCDLLSSLLKVGEWNKAPAEALKIVVKLDEEYGGNIAIGQHPKLGFFVLHDQNYGIDLVWKEKKDELEFSSVQNSVSSEIFT
jgi:hypothetical protein